MTARVRGHPLPKSPKVKPLWSRAVKEVRKLKKVTRMGPNPIGQVSTKKRRSPVAFFTELEQNIFNLYGHTNPLTVKTILREKNRAEGIMLPDLRLSVQFSSVTQSCPTLCNPMDCSTPGLPVHHQLPEFTQTHVH